MGQTAPTQGLAALAAETTSSIQAAASTQVVSIEDQLRRRQLLQRNHEWRDGRRRKRRAHRIILGLTRLAAAGSLPEVQELIKVLGPLSIWSGSSSAGEGWDHTWGIVLTAEAIVIHDEVFIDGKSDASYNPLRHELPYDCVATWSSSAWLADLCGRTKFIDFRDEEGMAMMPEEEFSTDLLWQHLAECANPKATERYVRKAIGG